MYHPQTQSQIVYEISGESIFDDKTGESLGGIVVFKDVTEYTKRIADTRKTFFFCGAGIWPTTAEP
jgi:hypothetical protein